MVSPKCNLIKQDLKSWAKVALLFFAVPAMMYITYVTGNIEIDGFAWSDFIPNTFIQGSLVTWFLGEILALIKKFVESNKY